MVFQGSQVKRRHREALLRVAPPGRAWCPVDGSGSAADDAWGRESTADSAAAFVGAGATPGPLKIGTPLM